LLKDENANSSTVNLEEEELLESEKIEVIEIGKDEEN
jgi:hypothetical protein